jgi:hypothetical protein
MMEREAALHLWQGLDFVQKFDRRADLSIWLVGKLDSSCLLFKTTRG